MADSPPSSLFGSSSRLHDRSERAAHIFRPPTKTPASPMIASTVAQGDYFSSGSRKRSRADSSQLRDNAFTFRSSFHEPLASNWAHYASPDDSMYGSGFEPELGMVNERYTLAGGFDTPSQPTPHSVGQFNFNADSGSRRFRDQDSNSIHFGNHIPLPPQLARERNGASRSTHMLDESPPPSWTGLAYNIVGRVFHFGTNVIRGFYAGGGKGYDLNTAPGQEPLPSPVPGSWHDNEFLGDFEQDNPTFSPSSARPPNKRRQTDRDTWILVGTPDTEPASRSPKRKAQNHETPRMSASVSARPSASRASSRRNMPGLHRRQASSVPSNGSPALKSHASISNLQKRASVASPRSPLTRSGILDPAGTSNDSDMERYARKQARDERLNQRAMNHMSRQMEELIRQAQEALGTKYSVEGDAGHGLEDEGFVDDE